MSYNLRIMGSGSTDAPKQWRLRLYGDFDLIAPSGKSVHLAGRKVEGLLAALAVHRTFGLSRDELGEILWPGKTLESQRTNLRQALTQLRKSIGESAVHATRSHCGLSSGFPLECDYHVEPGLHRNAFMPGHSGEWFESIRSASMDTGSPARVPISVVESFAQTLNWFAENDPRALAAIVRASGSLVRGIAPSQMLQLLKIAGKHALPRGWYAYWKGAMENDLKLSASWLESALPEAAREGDDLLAIELALELGKVYSRTGQLDLAKRMIALADMNCSQRPTTVSLAKAARLRGAVLSHWGDPAEGIVGMRRAEDLLTDPLEHSSVRATRGLFELVAGHEAKAMKTLTQPNAMLAETGHCMLELNCGLADLLLKSKGAGYRDAIQPLSEFSNRAYSVGCSQYGVYADEMLARALRLSGDRAAAAERTRRALAARRSASMVRTPWEMRLVSAVG